VDPAGAEPVLRRAAELAAVVGDDWGHIEACQVLAYSHLYRSDHNAAIDCADQALAALARLGHGQLRAWDHAVRAEAAAQAGRFSDAEADGRAGLALALAIEEPVSAGGSLLPLVRTLVHLGRAAEATTLVGEVRPFFDTHPGLGTSLLLDLAAAIAACWTEPRTALDVVTRAHHAAAGAGLPLVEAEAGVLLALVQCACGDTDGAQAAAAAARTLASGIGNGELAAAADLAACAADRTADGVPGRAHTALGDSAQLGLRPLVADGLDVVAGLALDAGRPAVTARLHAASSRLRAELGACMSPLARTIRLSDEESVAGLLTAGELATAHEEGARLDVAEAVAYASRSRGRRRRPASGWDSLTPTERDVVALVTRGLGNQVIADQLLIGAGTVRTHLRSIFGKLAVRSRAELAANAARRGL
jgi:DNA-binding CsgD family transcriptional regulator